MTRVILIYGAIAGLVIIGANTLSMELGLGQAWLGFLVMFIAFSTIYVAVKQYRDQTLGGVVTFAPALLLGLGISAVAAVVYVVIWELYLMLTDFAFVDTYASAMVESKALAGASASEVAEAERQADQFRSQYANPLFRLPMTFLEIFPVGLLISLVSAFALRNHRVKG